MINTSKTEIKRRVRDFVKTWQNSGDEVADKATYWNTLLSILGVPQEKIDDHSFIKYEYKINTKQIKFHGAIDAYIPSTRVLIEQKSNGVSLTKPENRPNGGDKKPITPLQQAIRYNTYLPTDEKARYIVLCNFNQFMIYDIRRSLDNPPIKLELHELGRNLYLFHDLIEVDKTGQERLQKEKNVSLKAGELVSKMYNELLKIYQQYPESNEKKVQRSINTLIVRLVFCLYAEDANLFDKEQFYNYLKPIPANKMGNALEQLFHVLDTKKEDRLKNDPFFAKAEPELMAFPYVNGGLYRDEDVIVPPFSEELKDILLEQASKSFDWSNISPTIFGAVFESTLNPDERRQGGMHYTSVENIHKVIDPLFLDDLTNEINQIEMTHDKTAARNFQDKISKLTFLDPACGSGNFLTESYLSLRRLENRALKILHPSPVFELGQAKDYIKVSIQHFYGFEINDFAVSVAKTALWIAESQMMDRTKDILYTHWHFLPLKTYTHIHEGNALKMNWDNEINDDPTHPNIKVNFVIGNPPFVGVRQQDAQQREDLKVLWHGKKSKMDYVTGWYLKAFEYIKGTSTSVAFVSTNSIAQGLQAMLLGNALFKTYKYYINFAYRSFVWQNAAANQAKVYCVIVSFSSKNNKKKYIFDEAGKRHVASDINEYLLSSAPVLLKTHSKPLCGQKKIERGNQLCDDGHFVLTKDEKDSVIKTTPEMAGYIFPYVTGQSFLKDKRNGDKQRYCLYLKNASPALLRSNKFVSNRVDLVKQFREDSGSDETNAIADTPTLYKVMHTPVDSGIEIPRVSSAARQYIPMGFTTKSMVQSDDLFVMRGGSLYDFGILESKLHMLWMKTIAGRLGKGFRYSSTIVYNDFPWPSPNAKQHQDVIDTAQGILDARKKYSDSSLADLYDSVVMPPDLLKAHKANDKAVMTAYGFVSNTSEEDALAALFDMYNQLV